MNTGMLTIGEKKLKYPIMQGGMGVGISLHNLAGAVAKEGGIGIISAAQIGFKELDFEKDPLKANLRAMKKELNLARKIAPEGIVGFNIMTAMRYYEEYVKEAVLQGADLIVSGAGLPTDLPKYVKGSDTKIAPIVSTVKSAKVILKYWDKKYNCTADLVVIEGPLAGGHLGFHKEKLQSLDDKTYQLEVKEIIAEIRKYEKKYEKKIPIFLAGGISTSEDYQKARKLGADGIQVGSRFVTTIECDANMAYKERYLTVKKEEIGIINSPVGMPGRAVLNAFTKRVERGEKFPCAHCHLCMKNCNPSKIDYCITDALTRAAQGDVENGLIFCGAKTYMADKIETVHDVIASFLL